MSQLDQDTRNVRWAEHAARMEDKKCNRLRAFGYELLKKINLEDLYVNG